MTEATVVDQDTVHELMTAEQKELLDAVDALRRENIDGDIDIPQILVCGNQSSGKSSVLEALAQVRFPIGHDTVTRFPIELILRHSADPGLQVKLCASKDRDARKKEQIEKFSPGFEVTGLKDFHRLVEAAREHLEKFEPTRKFWSDWLRAEISGPQQTHLTLVDLPGLIHTENSSDKASIKTLVKRFMRADRTMVVAIFDAMCEDLQNILGLVAESLDDVQARTIGVITKPDLLTEGSDLQKAVMKIARNEEIHLGLGWHVVRNLKHEDSDRSREHHDQVESDFFSTGEWATLGRAKTGIVSLRQRLSQGLLECVTGGMQRLLAEMDGQLEKYKRSKKSLGQSRYMINEQRVYLNDIMERFTRLVEASLDGDYFKKEFEPFFSDANDSKVREKIYHVLSSFARDMVERGQTQMVQGSLIPIGQNPNDVQKYCEDVAAIISKMRGKGLPGQVPGSALQAIFRQQSRSWETISRKHLDDCLKIVDAYVRLAAFYVAGPYTGGILLHKYMIPAVDQRAEALWRMLESLLWPYQHSHPMAYSSRYKDTIATLSTGSSRREDSGSNSQIVSRHAPLAVCALRQNWGHDLVNAAEAIDKAEVYYCLARDTFTENVPTLAVEACLLANLDNILPKEEIWGLDDEAVSDIAAEPEHIRYEREELRRQINALERAKTIFGRHAGQVYDSSSTDESTSGQTTSPQLEPTESRTTLSSAAEGGSTSDHSDNSSNSEDSDGRAKQGPPKRRQIQVKLPMFGRGQPGTSGLFGASSRSDRGSRFSRTGEPRPNKSRKFEFQPYVEKDKISGKDDHWHSFPRHEGFQKYSFEEDRWYKDYMFRLPWKESL